MSQTINLILETRADYKIAARSTDFPDCVAVAETREEAIAFPLRGRMSGRGDRLLYRYYRILREVGHVFS